MICLDMIANRPDRFKVRAVLYLGLAGGPTDKPNMA
jgi:hypothetical protein